MTLPNPPSPGSQGQWSPPQGPDVRWSPDQSPAVPVAPVAPVSMSSPLAPIVAPKKGTSLLNLLLGLALVVAIGGVAFAAGRLTAPAAAAAGGNGTGFGRGGFGGPSGASGAGGTGGGGGLGGAAFGAGGGITIKGTVAAITPTSISLTLESGQTIDIPISSTTTFHGQAAATSADVTTGKTVQVQVTGGFGRGGGQGGFGQGGANASAPPPVGGGTSQGGSGPTGGTGFGNGAGGARGIGAARDITIVTP